MQSNSDNAEVPVLGVFQFDANTVSQGVNLFRGNLAFPLKLITLPGGGGLSFELTILYQSNVDTTAGTWNLTAPTGPLGLGWSMPQDRIIAGARSSGSSFESDYFLISGGQTSHLEAIPAQWSRQGGTLPSSARAYEASGNPFWEITFYPDEDKWVVIREDGIINTYGGTGQPIGGNSSANVLEYGIRWNNWIGPSRMSANQQRYVRGWHLSRVENSTGNHLLFNYAVVEQAVGDGSLTYTRETHLDSMQNDLGWTCKFSYLPMTYDDSSLSAPKEYLPAHGDPSFLSTQPNAWQDQYNTQYLHEVAVTNGVGATQVTLRFNYDQLRNLTVQDDYNSLGYGTTYKRFLLSIDEIWGSGTQKPGVELEYNYTTDATQNRGALTKITYPTGGSTVVAYTQVSIGANDTDDPGSRNIVIDNPFGTGTNGVTRTWYGPDYVVNAWYSSSAQTLMLNVYTWVGRWYPAQTTSWSIDGAIDIDALQAATGMETFVLSVPQSGTANTNVYLFNREPQAYATWTPQGGGAPQPISYATSSLTIATGDDFYVLVDNSSGVVDRYAWNWMNQNWDIAHLVGSGICAGSSGQYNYYATAGGNYHLVACYDRQQTSTRFTLMYRDPLLAWQTGSQFDTSSIQLGSMEGFSYIGFGPSASFVALAWVTAFNVQNNALTSFNYSENVLQWDENYQNLAFAQLPSTSQSGFTNVPAGILNSLGPIIIDNTLVASGPNLFLFDGVQWTYAFIGIQYPAGTGSDPQQQYYWYGYSADTAIRTENTDAGIYSALTGIDFNNPAPGWQTQILTNQSPPPPSRQTQYYPTLSGVHMTQGVNVYGRSVYTNWLNLPQLQLAQLTGTIDTTTMIDQPPYFIAWSSTDNTGAPLATNLITFLNGNLVRTPQGYPVIQTLNGQQMFSLFDQQERAQTALSGKLPAVPLGFITFPTTATLDATPTISLHRYANGGVQGAITTFVVSSLVTDSGYFTQSRCYLYEQITASSDDSGTIVRFNKVASFDGCTTPSAQQYGYTISYFFNGLPPTGISSFDSSQPAAGVYSVLDGMLIRQEQYDVSQNLVSVVENTWTAATQVSTDAAATNLRNIWGGIPRIAQTVKQLDGVRRATVYEYSNASGAPQLVTNTYYNSAGQLVTRQIATKFAFEQYPSLWRANILTPAAETQTRLSTGSSSAIAPIIVQTVKQWTKPGGEQYWAEWESWIPVSADAPAFAQWDGSDPGPLWRRTETIVARTPLGQPAQSIDVQGRPVTILYDDQYRLPIANFINATAADNGVSYDSFEPYQASTWSAPTGGSVISTDSFTGQSCMQLTASGTMQKSVTVDAATGSYVFALWYKTPASGVTGSLSIAASGGSTLTFALPPTNGQWQNAQWVADLAGLGLSGAATLTLQITAAITAGALLVDDVVFTPLLSIFGANVYDVDDLFRTAQLELNANVRRQFRNLMGGIAGQSGVWENPTGFSTSFLSTQLADDFQPATPNARFVVSARDQGFYDLFKSGALSAYTPINSSLSDWATQNHTLQLVNASSAPLGAQVSRTGFSAPSVGIYVQVGSASTNTISIGTGTYFVLWNGTQWQLVQLTGTTLNVLATNASVPFGNEWIFCAFDDRILFLADGAQVFSYSAASVAGNHGVQLGMQQPGSFAGLIVCQTITVQMNFSDGIGRPTQTVAMETGDSVLLTDSLYDDRGNAAIQVKPSRVTSTQVPNPFAYYSGYVTNAQPRSALWSGGPMTGDAVTIYHPDDGGYPFTRKVAEASPLARLLQQGEPGIEFAITTAGNTHIQTYAYGTNTDTGSFLYPLPANQFLLVTGTDPNGNVTVTWTDTEQNQIGVSVQPPGGGATWSNSMVHDLNAQPVASIPPSYYASAPPPANAIPAAATQMSYDYLGQRISASSPNTGTSQYLYNRASLQRFMQDPAAAAAGVIRYIKYDALNRIIEDGYYATAWDPAALAPHLDDNTWPPAPDTWSVRRTYDGDATTPNMVGHLWKTFGNSAGQQNADFTEVYALDVAGNIVSQTRQVTEYNSGQAVSYQQTFDRTGTLLTATDSATNLTTTNVYNALGQITAVTGQVGGGGATPLLQYAYTQEGKLLSVRVGSALTREYSYNSPSWVTGITDPASSESLTYTTGSCQSGGFWNGDVASQTTKLGSAPAESNCFNVDSLDRIVQAGSGASEITWQIDDNGNFQTVVDAGVTRTYTYVPGTDQLQSGTTSDHSYDRSYLYNGSGNVTTISSGSTQVAALTYSPGMNIVQSVTTPSATITYQYDTAGQRTLKTVTGTNASQTFLFPVGNSSLQITAGTALRYVDFFGVRIAFTNGTYYFGLTDHLGSTRALVTIHGSVVGQFGYDVYGALTVVQAPPIPYARFFNGISYDATLGLYEFPARLYDPILGRFLAIDPLLQQPSPYVYGGNNPMVMIDPSGMAAWYWFLAAIVVGAVVAVVTGGIGAAFVGGGIGAAMAVGAVAGAAGTLASDAIMAYADGQAFTWQRALIDIAGGAIGGIAGAGVGGAVGSLVSSRMLNAGFAAGRITVANTLSSGVSGGVAGAIAQSGAVSILTGDPFFSKANAINVALGAVTGFGAGAMAARAHFNWLTGANARSVVPVPLTSAEFGGIRSRMRILPTGERVLLNIPHETANGRRQIRRAMIDEGYSRNQARKPVRQAEWLTEVRQNGVVVDKADVAISHGVGGHVIVQWQHPVTLEVMYRPMTPATYADYLQTRGFGNNPVKLISCFGTSGGRFWSVAQTLSDVLGQRVYGHWKVMFPVHQGPWGIYG
jgi:RHS repeat-associated protein